MAQAQKRRWECCGIAGARRSHMGQETRKQENTQKVRAKSKRSDMSMIGHSHNPLRNNAQSTEVEQCETLLPICAWHKMSKQQHRKAAWYGYRTHCKTATDTHTHTLAQVPKHMCHDVMNVALLFFNSYLLKTGDNRQKQTRCQKNSQKLAALHSWLYRFLGRKVMAVYLVVLREDNRNGDE